MQMIITSIKTKTIRSSNYNLIFDKETGYSVWWGSTEEETPQRCPYGPTHVDIEIVSMCEGPGGHLCPFCYKSNTNTGSYMSLDTYKKILDILPDTVCQVAIGADANLTKNPDIWKILEYTREKGIVPNITVADIDQEAANRLANVCGAVAVSWYGIHSDKDICYNSIHYLCEAMKQPNATLKQVNMHFMLSKETSKHIDELIQDIKTDSRLKDLNAIVFLSLKQKGRGKHFRGLRYSEFKQVVKKLLDNNIPFGFDSCSQPKFIKTIKEIKPDLLQAAIESSESCESLSHSIYINDKGTAYPCSFLENENWNRLSNTHQWDMLSLKNSEEFQAKVWNSLDAIEFSQRAHICANCEEGCQYYTI